MVPKLKVELLRWSTTMKMYGPHPNTASFLPHNIIQPTVAEVHLGYHGFSSSDSLVVATMLDCNMMV